MKLIICLSLSLILSINKINGQSTSTNENLIPCYNLYGETQSSDGLCMLVEDCTGAALSGNCPNKNHTCCKMEKKSNYEFENFISKDLFLKIAGNTKRNQELYGYFSESVALASIKTNYAAAAYLSQLIGETNYFRFIESAKPEVDTNPNIGNIQKGDGSKYRGRGGILLRGKENYRLAQDAKISEYDLLSSPERAAYPSSAFKIAAWFWKNNAFIIKEANKVAKKGDLNQLADDGTFLSFTHLTHSLTNNLQSLKERADVNDLILSELKTTSIKRGQGVTCRIEDESGYAVPMCLLEFKKSYCGCEGKYDMKSCPYGSNTFDGRCRNSAIIKCCIEKCKTSLDLVILMDSSSSINETEFVKEKLFVKEFIKNLALTKDQTRVSIINFNTKPYLVIPFLNETKLENLINTVDNIPYSGGGTRTDLALLLANNKVLNVDNGMRPPSDGVPKVVLVLTDGQSDDYGKTMFEANKLKKKGVNIVSIGVGKEIKDLEELIDMASSPKDQYYVNDFDQIIEIISAVSKTTCQQPCSVNQEVEIKTQVEKDSFKYFKFPLEIENKSPRNENENENYLNKFTIELEELNGRTELFYSFEEENPKSVKDQIEANKSDVDENYFERSFLQKIFVKQKIFHKFSLLKKSKQLKSSKRQTKFYQIVRPQSGQNKVVYFSVKGLDEENKFKIYVYNRTMFNFDISIHNKFSYLNLVSSFVLVFFAKKYNQ